MVAIVTPGKVEYRTVGEWLDITGAERSGNNIVRTLGTCIIIEPPDSKIHPVLRITSDGVEMFGPRYNPNPVLEWLSGIAGVTLVEAIAVYSAFLSGKRLSVNFGTNDYVQVNVERLPIINRKEKILDYRWQ